MFEWTAKCQITWEDIKNWYIQVPILISPNQELEFHVHIDAYQLTRGAILAQNPTGEIYKPVMYSSRMFNFVEQNYITTKRKALVMVYALQKFRHYMLDNNVTFFVDHTTLIYLVNKPQVYSRLAKWFLLFMEYDFKIDYKLSG